MGDPFENVRKHLKRVPMNKTQRTAVEQELSEAMRGHAELKAAYDRLVAVDCGLREELEDARMVIRMLAQGEE